MNGEGNFAVFTIFNIFVNTNELLRSAEAQKLSTKPVVDLLFRNGIIREPYRIYVSQSQNVFSNTICQFLMVIVFQKKL